MRFTIEKLVYGGDGLTRLPPDEHGRGKVAFIPFVLEEETVEATTVEDKPGFARLRAEEILQSSPGRIAPLCPYFARCGGCQYQHASYKQQIEIKTAILKENLRRIAKYELRPELRVHPSPPWEYRNRARLQVRTAPEFALGYHKFGSHELLPVEQCPISSRLINQAIQSTWQLGRAGKIPAGMHAIEFFADAEDARLVVEIYGTPEVAAAAPEEFLAELNAILPQAQGVALLHARAGQATETGEPKRVGAAGDVELIYRTKNAEYRVSAGSFFQVNRYLIDTLAELVAANRKGGLALDLYAGVGLFASVLNREFEQVIAVESSPTSHADLLYNAPANVKPVRASTEQYLESGAASHLRPDLIVVDPPRAGLGERVIRGLVKLNSPRLTYVACDPATFSRDLSRLLAAGYQPEDAHLVDLFPQTYHIESVFHLVR